MALLRLNWLASFNPRARDGREYRSDKVDSRSTGFNPRARDGRESKRYIKPIGMTSFNPRARDGREIQILASKTTGKQFQSTRP